MASGGGEPSQSEELAQVIQDLDGDVLCGVDFNATQRDTFKPKKVGSSKRQWQNKDKKILFKKGFRPCP